MFTSAVGPTHTCFHMGLLEGSDLSMVDYMRSKQSPMQEMKQQFKIDKTVLSDLKSSTTADEQWLVNMTLVWYGPLAASLFKPGVPWTFQGDGELRVYNLIAQTIEKLEQLPGYKHLLPILHYDCGTVYSSPFEDTLEDRKELDLSMTKQLFSAVQYLHASGFRHNQINAQNIVYKENNYYLTHFDSVTHIPVGGGRTVDLKKLCETLLPYAAKNSNIQRFLSACIVADNEDMFALLISKLGIPSLSHLKTQRLNAVSAEEAAKESIAADVKRINNRQRTAKSRLASQQWAEQLMQLTEKLPLPRDWIEKTNSAKGTSKNLYVAAKLAAQENLCTLVEDDDKSKGLYGILKITIPFDNLSAFSEHFYKIPEDYLRKGNPISSTHNNNHTFQTSMRIMGFEILKDPTLGNLTLQFHNDMKQKSRDIFQTTRVGTAKRHHQAFLEAQDTDNAVALLLSLAKRPDDKV